MQKIIKSKQENIIIFSHAKLIRLIIVLLTHSKYENNSQAMKDLHSYSYRLPYIGTVELFIDDDRNIFLKDLRKTN